MTDTYKTDYTNAEGETVTLPLDYAEIAEHYNYIPEWVVAGCYTEAYDIEDFKYCLENGVFYKDYYNLSDLGQEFIEGCGVKIPESLTSHIDYERYAEDILKWDAEWYTYSVKGYFIVF